VIITGPIQSGGWRHAFPESKCVSLSDRERPKDRAPSSASCSALCKGNIVTASFRISNAKCIITATKLRAGRPWLVQFPSGEGNFSLHHFLQTGSGAHPASYPMGTGSSFPGDKVAGAWTWPLTSSPSWEADSHLDIQENPRLAFYGTRRYIMVFTRTRQVRGPVLTLRNKLLFLRPRWGISPCRLYETAFIQYTRSYPPYLDAVSSNRNPRRRHALVTGTHITQPLFGLLLHSHMFWFHLNCWMSFDKTWSANYRNFFS
jgi:hypothetical protein